MLHLCLDIGGPTLSFVIAARSYFRPLDVGAIVFNVRSNVDFPFNILPCRVISGVVRFPYPCEELSNK